MLLRVLRDVCIPTQDRGNETKPVIARHCEERVPVALRATLGERRGNHFNPEFSLLSDCRVGLRLLAMTDAVRCRMKDVGGRVTLLRDQGRVSTRPSHGRAGARPSPSRTFSAVVRPALRKCLVTVGLLLCPAVHAATGSWWNDDWACRKTVSVVPVGDVAEHPAAAITFTTGGELKPDAADLRVINQDGEEVPHSVIASGFEDLCTVAFPVDRPRQEFHLYYGNRGARRARYDWEPRRGLVLEVRTMGQGGLGNADQMQELVRNSPEIQGRALHPCVFDGHNRFGPSDRYVSVYKGWLNCPVAGPYRFATTSDDASFLLVNGRLVVQWPGRHRAVPNARHNASVTLPAGVYSFEYYHVEVDDLQVAEAAWQPPGQTEFTVIPPGAFAPFWSAQVTAYRKRDDPDPLDFIFWQESCLEAEGALLSAMRFDPASRSARGGTGQWDFGDGVTSDSRKPVHVYAQPGTYTVTLRVGERRLSQEVRVWENERLGVDPVPRTIVEYVKLLDGYDLSKMEPGHVFAIARFAGENGVLALEDKAYTTLERMPESFRDVTAGHALIAHADDLWRLGQYDAAVDLLDNVASTHSNRTVLCTASYKQGRYLLALEKPDEALPLFDRLKGRTTAMPKFRALALSGIGDVHRAQGKEEKALEQYRQAQEVADALPAGAALARGAYSQAVLEYLRAGEFEAALEQVERWEAAVPTDKLEGYLSLLKTISLFKLGDAAQGHAEARDQYAGNPAGNYAPHMLLLQGDCLALWGKTDESRERYGELLEKYPESPLAEVARFRADNPPQNLPELKFPVLDF